MKDNSKFGSSDSLIAAVRSIMEKEHTVPKGDKEKKLAALAHPKDKITHKDVLVGRGVLKKENSGERMGTIVATRKEKVELDPKLKEEEQVDERADEHGYSLHKAAHKRVRGQTGGFDEPVAATKMTYTVKQHGKKVGEIHKHRDTYEPTAMYTGHLHGKKIPYSRTDGHGVHALMKDIVGSKWHAKHAPKVTKEEVDQVDERKLTGAETDKKEKYVMSLKKKMGGFKKRYGERAKEVMYATATKMAKEEVEQIDEISPKVLKSYVKKAEKEKYKHDPDSDKARKRDAGIYKANSKIEDDKVNKRVDKLIKHVKPKMNKESVSVQEISTGLASRYLKKTDPETSSPKEVEKRKTGRALALTKKWGGRVSGTSAPKVPTKD